MRVVVTTTARTPKVRTSAGLPEYVPPGITARSYWGYSDSIASMPGPLTSTSLPRHVRATSSIRPRMGDRIDDRVELVCTKDTVLFRGRKFAHFHAFWPPSA